MTESIKKVLVVLRHRKNGKEIVAALERRAFSVDVAHKGIEALKVLQRSCPYDLVITELLLDEISGFALFVTTRKYPDVATIGLNNGDPSLKLVAHEFGVDKVLESPPDLKKLCDVSLEILGRMYTNQLIS